VGVLDDIVPFGNRETDFLAHRNICSAETHPSLVGEMSTASSIM
jgi:hypothetical protein